MNEIFPPIDELEHLEPEEIAGIILVYLNQRFPREEDMVSHQELTFYQQESNEKRMKAFKLLMEGWEWLKREGLIAQHPGYSSVHHFITRRGRQINEKDGIKVYVENSILPQNIIHPKIIQKVRSDYIRGEYDSAILKAFREVEVNVRKASGLPTSLIGVRLMRKAFDPIDGVLRDTSSEVVDGEREAASHLFAGSIGLFRNPSGHRDVPIRKDEAWELIVFASRLLKIVDERKATC